MSANRRPPELKEEDASLERVRTLIRSVNRVAEGFVYVYMWNVGTVKNPPLGLYILPENVETACLAVEDMGEKKTTLKDGATQFDMSEVSGVPGNTMVFHKTGKIMVSGTEKSGGRSAQVPSNYDFFTSTLIDVIDVVTKATSGFRQRM